jgi:hypothetical protein
MNFNLKKILLMTFWMGITGGAVITIDTIFNPPDEISGVLYFLSIGVAASATLNYYK